MSTHLHATTLLGWIVGASLSVSSFAIAQDAEAPADPPAAPAATDEDETTDEPQELPDLDDLLGIDDGDDDSEAGDPARDELERVLTGGEIGDAFVQAVSLMDNVADRIEDEQDTGLATQRLQEDIVRRLDQLIESVKQNQSSSSSSSSSSQQQQQQQQQPNQPQPSDGQSQPSGEPNQSSEAPGRQDGALRPELDAATAGWGELPDRVRDMLMQGTTDRFSELYQRMTEAYYRRLAEESSGQ